MKKKKLKGILLLKKCKISSLTNPKLVGGNTNYTNNPACPDSMYICGPPPTYQCPNETINIVCVLEKELR